MTQKTTQEKLSALRALMQKEGLDYYYVPARDQHNNEYVPDCWQRRAWISAFTGSAGDVLVGLDQAYLWTDARYFLQAEHELDLSLFQIMRQQQGMAAPIHVWLADNAHNKTIGVDPSVISIGATQKWQAALQQAGGTFKAVSSNLVDSIWDNRPVFEAKPVSLLGDEYHGKSTHNKLTDVRAAMLDHDAHHHVVSALDAIGWLFNIRGKDIEYNPLVMSFAVVSRDSATLFINPTQINEGLTEYLEANGVSIAHYDDLNQSLHSLSGNVWVDPNTTLQIVQALDKATVRFEKSPITLMKACKNPVELKGAFEAHRRDGLAVCKFLHWVENNWKKADELAAAAQLKAFREEDDHLQGLSFETITGFGEHGAIVHYRCDEASSCPLGDDNLYLVDSGGQYLEGTTDITRTMHLGKPTAEQKEHYTLVLKGHLALRHALFPAGTMGEQVDALARQFLWKEGMDYGHGTGHGVGAYLCVHEGPQRISGATTKVPLLPSMIVSNEPGVYFAGEYGIRIENLCAIEEKVSIAQSPTGHGPFLGLTDLTKVPYAQNLIDANLLTPDEIKQVNDYHHDVYETLSGDLPEDVRIWLEKATQPLVLP